MTANMVPVWSMTRMSVIAGEEGSRCMSFSATTTCAELETGRSSGEALNDGEDEDFEQGHEGDSNGCG